MSFRHCFLKIESFKLVSYRVILHNIYLLSMTAFFPGYLLKNVCTTQPPMKRQCLCAMRGKCFSWTTEWRWHLYLGWSLGRFVGYLLNNPGFLRVLFFSRTCDLLWTEPSFRSISFTLQTSWVYKHGLLLPVVLL